MGPSQQSHVQAGNSRAGTGKPPEKSVRASSHPERRYAGNGNLKLSLCARFLEAV